MANATPASARRKLLVTTIPVTPTKPLTPSHVKLLLWLDVLYKATAQAHDVTYLNNRTTFDASGQTIGFWIYLDTHYPDIDYATRDEAWIGERYVEHHRAGAQPAPEAVRAYRARVEQYGWIHDASRRIIDIWEQQYQVLHLRDPGLRNARPLDMSAEEVLELLAARGLLLDMREMGAPVYLDLTREGMPLRQIVDPDGLDNYLLYALREIIPLARQHDAVGFLCDQEMGQDAVLLPRVLQHLGHEVERMPVGRVPLGGVSVSTRHGGWQDYTLDRLCARFLPEHDLDAFRLGLRLYFVATLGWTAKQSFRFDLLERCLRRAQGMLAGASTRPDLDASALLARVSRPSGYVDPYRFTAQLMSRDKVPGASAWITSVLLS